MIDEFRNFPKVWRISMIGSLILNLFLLALTAGHLLRAEFQPRAAGTPLARALANAGTGLSKPDATVFRNVIRTSAPHFADAAQNLVNAREALRHQIEMEPFNRDATKQAYAAWQRTLNIFIEDFGDALVDALGQISTQGRRKILDERRQRLADVPGQRKLDPE
jgi:uncharacterized membrane protein